MQCPIFQQGMMKLVKPCFRGAFSSFFFFLLALLRRQAGYKNTMGSTAFLIFALPSPELLGSVKSNQRKKNRSKEHRFGCKTKMRSKTSQLVFLLGFFPHEEVRLLAFNSGPIQYLHVVNIINSIHTYYSRNKILLISKSFLLIVVKSAFSMKLKKLLRIICCLPSTYTLLVLIQNTVEVL